MGFVYYPKKTTTKSIWRLFNMRTTMSNILQLFVLVTIALVTASTALAGSSFTQDTLNAGDTPPLFVELVKVNGIDFTANQNAGTNYLDLERDNELEIQVRLQATAALEDVEVEASVTGYEYNDNKLESLSDSAEPFNAEAGRTYVKTVTIKLPELLNKGQYKLRVLISGKNTQTLVYNYNVDVSAAKHSIMIKDVTFTPGQSVKAGKSITSVVRVKNVGLKTEENIKVKVAISELGISQVAYIDELKAESSKSSEELDLKIPLCTKPGVYTLAASIDFDNFHGKDVKEYDITVFQNEQCPAAQQTPGGQTQTPGQQTVTQPVQDVVEIAVNTETQLVTKGQGGTIYPVVLSNKGTTAKTYTIQVDGVTDWATTKLSPSGLVVLNPGETKAIYVYVAANENAAAGERMFSVTIKSGDTVIKQVPLKADVVEASAGAAQGTSLKTVLQYALITLFVILVIVGIVLLVQKMKGDDEQTTTDVGQTYY